MTQCAAILSHLQAGQPTYPRVAQKQLWRLL